MKNSLKRTAAIIIICLMLPVYGCATDSIASTAATTRAAQETTPGSVTTAPPAAETTTEKLNSNSYSWNYANKKGYTATLTVNIYEPIYDVKDGVITHPQSTSFVLGKDDFNSSTDLVIPATFIMQNTTENFSVKLEAQGFLLANWGTRTSADVTVVQNFSDELSFTALSGDADLFGCSWSDPISSNESVKSNFFIIIPNYYSPNSPNGDKSLWENITFAPIGYFGSEDVNNAYTDDAFHSSDAYGITLSGQVESINWFSLN